MRPAVWRALALTAAAAVLAACASTPPPTAGAAGTGLPPGLQAPSPPVAAQERVRRAAAFLERGQAELARYELTALLAEHPRNAAGRRLLDQIERDPRALLGERNFSYKARPGETLPGLAQRFLGDRMLVYALARYNGIAAPDAPLAGRTLLIPGAAKKPAAPTRTASAPSPPSSAATTAAAPAAPPPAASASPPGGDPARAGALRRAALDHMNSGAVDQAVALLQQAAPLDPGNTAIRGDLDRALRIQASLRRR